jgi:hypothetical protein
MHRQRYHDSHNTTTDQVRPAETRDPVNTWSDDESRIFIAALLAAAESEASDIRLIPTDSFRLQSLPVPSMESGVWQESQDKGGTFRIGFGLRK